MHDYVLYLKIGHQNEWGKTQDQFHIRHFFDTNTAIKHAYLSITKFIWQ